MEDEKPNIPPVPNQSYTLDQSGPCEVIVIDDSEDEPQTAQGSDKTKNAIDSESDDDENERGTGASLKRKKRPSNRKLRRSSSMDSLSEEQSDANKARSTIRPAKSASTAHRSSRADAIRRTANALPSTSVLPPTTQSRAQAATQAQALVQTQAETHAQAQAVLQAHVQHQPRTQIRSQTAPEPKPKRFDPTKAARDLLLKQQRLREEEETKKKMSKKANARSAKAAVPKSPNRTDARPSGHEPAPKRLRTQASTAPKITPPESPNIEGSPNPPTTPTTVPTAPSSGPNTMLQPTPNGSNQALRVTEAQKLEPTSVPAQAGAVALTTNVDVTKLETRKLFIKFRPRRFDFPQSEGLAMYSPFPYLMTQTGFDKDSVCSSCGDFNSLDFTCQRCKLKFHKSCMRPQSDMYCRACEFVSRGPNADQVKSTGLWQKLTQELSEGNAIDMVLTPKLFVKYVQQNSTDWLRCYKCKKFRTVPVVALSECIRAPFTCEDAYWLENSRCQKPATPGDSKLLERPKHLVENRKHRRQKLFMQFGAKNSDLFNRVKSAPAPAVQPRSVTTPKIPVASAVRSTKPPAQPANSNGNETRTFTTALQNATLRPTTNSRTQSNPPGPRAGPPQTKPPAANINGTVTTQHMHQIHRSLMTSQAMAAPKATLQPTARNGTPATVPRNAPAHSIVYAQPQRVVVSQSQPAASRPATTHVIPPQPSSLSYQRTVPTQPQSVQYRPAVSQAPGRPVATNFGSRVTNNIGNSQQVRPPVPAVAPSAQVVSKPQAPTAAQMPSSTRTAQALAVTQTQPQSQAQPGQSTSAKLSADNFRVDVCRMIGKLSSPGEVEDALVDMVQSEDKELMGLYLGFGKLEDIFLRQAKRLAERKLDIAKKKTTQNEPEVKEVPVQQPKVNARTVPRHNPTPAALNARMQLASRFRDQRVAQMQQEIQVKHQMIEQMKSVNLKDVHFLHVEQVQQCRAVCQRQSQELLHLMATTPGLSANRRVVQPQQLMAPPQQRFA